MRHSFFTFFGVFIVIALTLPSLAIATPQKDTQPSPQFVIGGWIPYWGAEKAIDDTRTHLKTLSFIHPFIYEVDDDGSIIDRRGSEKEKWIQLVTEAQRNKTSVIPTITWHNSDAIDEVLRDPTTRKLHIDVLLSLVKREGYDGVDIDYENKLAKTRPYFSLFLKELKSSLHNKILTCAIEARTPPESLYRTIPHDIEYANDYEEIGTWCDQVTIMAYDQGRADLLLNDEKKGVPYAPVADSEWVRKVLSLAVTQIPKEKISLGIPTYGYEYDVTVSPYWFQTYSKVRSLSFRDAVSLASEVGATPSRNNGGEWSFSYLPGTSPYYLPSSLPLGPTDPGNLVALQALSLANLTGWSLHIRYVTISDSLAIQEKITIARELGITHLSFFKIDGKEDPLLWKLLKK